MTNDDDQRQPSEEEMDIYNETFNENDDSLSFSDSITVGNVYNWTTDEMEYVIGTRDGDGRYVMFYDRVWERLLRVIYYRLQVVRGSSCLLNMRSLSEQVREESNIKSIVTIENTMIELLQTAFGVSDPEDPSEDHFRKSDDIIDELKNTLEFWGTLGRRTKSKKNQRRAVRVYQVKDGCGKKIMRYIEREIPDVKQ